MDKIKTLPVRQVLYAIFDDIGFDYRNVKFSNIFSDYVLILEKYREDAEKYRKQQEEWDRHQKILVEEMSKEKFRRDEERWAGIFQALDDNVTADDIKKWKDAYDSAEEIYNEAVDIICDYDPPNLGINNE